MSADYQAGGDARRDRGARRHRVVRRLMPAASTRSSSTSTACSSKASSRAIAMLAELLTELGHPTQRRRGDHDICRLERPAISSPRSSSRSAARCPPSSTNAARRRPSRALREGIPAVAGAVEFVRSPAAGPAQGGRLVELDALAQQPPRPSRSDRRVRRSRLQRPRACRARQARARPLSSCRATSSASTSTQRDPRGFGGRRDRRARLRRPGHRPGRRLALSRRPRRRCCAHSAFSEIAHSFDEVRGLLGLG